MTDKEYERRLRIEFDKGVECGIKIMKERMLLAAENGNPIDINGRAYFVKDDMDNLRERIGGIEED